VSRSRLGRDALTAKRLARQRAIHRVPRRSSRSPRNSSMRARSAAAEFEEEYAGPCELSENGPEFVGRSAHLIAR
jgi:hypothetical protein